MKSNREKVYEVVNEERAYQEEKWPRPAHNHSGTEYMVYIHVLSGEALQRVTHEQGDEAVHDAMRKIAALAVACMEEHGPSRRLPKD